MSIFRGPCAYSHRWLLCVALGAGAACQTRIPEIAPVPPDSPAPQAVPVEPGPPIAEIQDLLIRADLAFEEDQLTYPESESAVDLYLAVLQLDPENQPARRGLERIVERFVALALTAAERRQFAAARSMLARARIVDADHPAIEPTTEQLRLLTQATREKLVLDKTELKARTPTIVETLAVFGAKARDDGCRVTISARNDAEGRWIYQQLSEAEGDRRIRAKLQLASPPSVELLCFDAPS